MCGILGSINVAFDNSTLDTIKHRGPDDSGSELFTINGNTVRLSQRRLSILELTAAGHQPMYSSCKNYAIIFNGEIYNHLELRKRLPNDICFKGHSDTETILYYLREFGINSVNDFNGIFSFSYLDLILNRLYLVRDPFGVKPMYYHLDGYSKVIFASEMRPIKSLLGNCHFDEEALATLLRLRYNPAPDTVFREIQKIRPGHYLEIQLNSESLPRKHKAFINEIPKTVNYLNKDVVNLYGNMLEDAVKRQLLSDVEIGVFLSGGIDSALIAAFAAKHYDGKLKAFTIGFEGQHPEDEIEAAAETAALLGLEHYSRKISFSDFLNVIKVCAGIVEEPLATTSIIPMYFLSQLAAPHVKVVLTGQGADEPLGGYTRYKSELIRDSVPNIFQNLVGPLSRLANIKNERMLRGAKAIGINDEIDRFLSVYEVFSLDEIQKLISVTEVKSRVSIEYFYNLLNLKIQRKSSQRMMSLDTRLNLPDDLLNYTDKITMHYSIECRVPMLDLELIEFIESLPNHLKLNFRHGGKVIHKKFAKEILPEKIINRRKKGFESPTRFWFKRDAHIVEKMLLAPDTVFSKYFNQKFVGEIINQHKQGHNREKQIFLLISTYYIMESTVIDFT